MKDRMLNKDSLPDLERRALEIRRRYEGCGLEFLGGRFKIQIGLVGVVWVQINSDGKIMKIETPEGAYLRP